MNSTIVSIIAIAGLASTTAIGKEHQANPAVSERRKIEESVLNQLSTGKAKPEFVMPDVKPDPKADTPQRITFISGENVTTNGVPGDVVCGGYYPDDGVLNVPAAVLGKPGTINLFTSGKKGAKITLYMDLGDGKFDVGGVVFVRDGGKYGYSSDSLLSLDGVGVWGTRLTNPSPDVSYVYPFPKAEGSIWRIGNPEEPGIWIGQYTIRGNPDDPITFALLDAGLSYLCGSGIVLRDDKVVFQKGSMPERKQNDKSPTKPSTTTK